MHDRTLVPQRDVIVIGASSGGVEALTTLLGALPDDLPASVFVILHVPPDLPSYLPAILNRAGGLPAAHAVDSEPVRVGRVYVAPPGLQTYLHKGRISVKRGPQENRHRPAVDPLFRTAARHYGPRVIGIILSGTLDDGAAGLRAIKRAGGTTIIQDPAEAAFPSMPLRAREASGGVDYCRPVAAIAQLLVELVPRQPEGARPPQEVPLETADEAPPGEGWSSSGELGHPASISCPDCDGALWEIDDGDSLRYRCRVGHAYTDASLVEAQGESVERALWTALRALEERAALLERLAGNARQRGHDTLASMFEERSAKVDEEARAIHRVIASGRVLDPLPSPQV